MKIKEITTTEELKNKNINSKNFTIVNVFYKQNFRYTIKIIENKNILLIITEDTKSEDFKIQFFEIVE